MSSSSSVMPVTTRVRKYQSSGEHMKVTMHACCRIMASQNPMSHILSSSSVSIVYGESWFSAARFDAMANSAALADAMVYRIDALKSSTSMSISLVVVFRRVVVYMANNGSR